MGDLPDDIDEKLWVTLRGGDPENKLYLYYNPHTFRGRMAVWRPRSHDVLYISKSDIETSSIEAAYWVKGFICGNEPDAPRTKKGYTFMNIDHPRIIRWREEIKLFTETGEWCDSERNCTNCGKALLHSQLGMVCPECLRNK